MSKSRAWICAEKGEAVDAGCANYIGLSDSPELAVGRALTLHRKLEPEGCVCLAVTFSLNGWMYCTTAMVEGWPVLAKKINRYGEDSGTWHYNKALPLELRSEETGESLVKVAFHRCV